MAAWIFSGLLPVVPILAQVCDKPASTTVYITSSMIAMYGVAPWFWLPVMNIEVFIKHITQEILATMKFLAALCTISSLLRLTLATSLQIHIPSSHNLPNPSTLSSSTHATLTSGNSPASRTLLRQDNSFLFPDISTTGSHLLTIYSPTHLFAPYRVDISPTNSTITGIWESYLGSPWTQTGPQLLSSPAADASFTAKCTSAKSFYEERPAFSPLSLLKNPMILMGVVALAFTFGMPKLMENMDPEMKAEYEEMQKKSPVSGLTRAMQGQASGAGGMEGFDLAGWMAGQKQGSDTGPRTSGADTGTDKIRDRRR